MDIDAKAAKLLAYLGRRITAVVGDNAPVIAGAIGLTVAELEAAAKALAAQGLATETAMTGSLRRWAVTDAGLALLLDGAGSKGANDRGA